MPISVVASFKKIKALISSNSQLAAVLRNSSKLVSPTSLMKVYFLCECLSMPYHDSLLSSLQLYPAY